MSYSIRFFSPKKKIKDLLAWLKCNCPEEGSWRCTAKICDFALICANMCTALQVQEPETMALKTADGQGETRVPAGLPDYSLTWVQQYISQQSFHSLDCTLSTAKGETKWKLLPAAIQQPKMCRGTCLLKGYSWCSSSLKCKCTNEVYLFSSMSCSWANK